jgi:hypothetical protein
MGLQSSVALQEVLAEAVLSDIELDAVTGGTKGAVVQAGWNLVQNKKAA